MGDAGRSGQQEDEGNGVLQRANMRRELITEDELMSQLRQHGIGDLSEVETACIEGDGRVSVIPKQKGEATQAEPDRRLA
ncbi:MAG: YetF domain-containing protein [Thermodesulfobacteriota bacterium]